MALDVGIAFPSEFVALLRHLHSEKDLTASERLAAAEDLFSVSEVLSQAGGVREMELARQAQHEQEWQRRMLEFIHKHGASR